MSRVFAQHWNDYELIDAGNDQKLERWGDVISIRPDRNAYFKPILSRSEWEKKAHIHFKEVGKNKGEWEILQDFDSDNWSIDYQGVKLKLKLTRFKHLGVFPEQQYNWDYIRRKIKPDERFLNLFGYTGAASLVARQAQADVFHCDSVKQVTNWAGENMRDSGLADIHWVVEDAIKFASREVKRGNLYNGIIMDPPAFGIGAKKERWKIEDKFSELMSIADKLLANQSFLLVNTYSPRLSESSIKETLVDYFSNDKSEVSTLCLKSTSGKTIEYGQLTKVSRCR